VNTKIGDERYHRCMSDMRPGAFPPAPGQPWGPPPPASSAQAPFAPLMTSRRPARWPSFTALSIALIALAVSLVGWFRPAAHNDQTSTPSKSTYTDRQTADAKAHMCAAFAKVARAVDVAGAVPRGSDETAQLAGATGIRQAFDVGSRYLLTKLAEEPATPSDLASAVRKEANSLQEGVIGYLDGLTNSDPEMRPLVDANTEAAATIQRLRK
jgi:hypothetical protein